MKILILFITLLSVSFSGSGQTQLAEFPLAWYLQKSEAFEVGDSLYITYSDIISHHDRKQAAWISNNGTISRFELGPLGNTDLIEVIRKGSDMFFYFVESDKKSKLIRLKAQRFNQENQKKEILEDEIILPGPIVAVFKADDLHVVCLTKETGVLSAFIVDGMELVKRQDVDFKMNARYLELSDIEFYNEGQLSGASIGSAPAKIIRQGNVIYFSLDGADRTTIFKVSLPDYHYEKFILDQSSTPNFTTFTSNDIIYKVSVDKKIISLDVYNLKSLDKLASMKSFYKFLPPYRTYERIGAEHKIQKVRTFDPVIGIGYEPPRWAMLVYNGERINSIRIGMSSEEGIPIGSIINPMGFMMLRGIFQINEGRGISRYMYFAESKDHLTLTDKENPETASPAQRADDYEILLRKKTKLVYKGYASVHGKLIGIYGTDDKKVMFIKF